MTCEFNDLKQLLNDKGLADAVEYVEAVRWKLIQAKLYSELAKEKDFGGILAQSQGAEINLSDPAVRHSLLQCEAHTVCLSQILHSVGDLAGQVVNESLLLMKGRQVQKDVFYLGDVINELDALSSSDCSEISGQLKALRDSAQFQYIAAFANTIKHRSLVNSKILLQYSVENGAQEGLSFIEFVYKKRTYGQAFAKVIYDDYLKAIELAICNWVEKLIEVLK